MNRLFGAVAIGGTLTFGCVLLYMFLAPPKPSDNFLQVSSIPTGHVTLDCIFDQRATLLSNGHIYNQDLIIYSINNVSPSKCSYVAESVQVLRIHWMVIDKAFYDVLIHLIKCYLKTLKMISIVNCLFDESISLLLLNECPQLTHFQLRNCKIHSSLFDSILFWVPLSISHLDLSNNVADLNGEKIDIKIINRFVNLKKVVLDNANISEQAFYGLLYSPKLIDVSMEDCLIEEVTSNHFKATKPHDIKRLNLKGTLISENQLNYIFSCYFNLESLILNYQNNISIGDFFHKLPKLEILILNGNSYKRKRDSNDGSNNNN